MQVALCLTGFFQLFIDGSAEFKQLDQGVVKQEASKMQGRDAGDCHYQSSPAGVGYACAGFSGHLVHRSDTEGRHSSKLWTSSRSLSPASLLKAPDVTT